MPWGGTVELGDVDRHEAAESARQGQGGDLWGRFHQLLAEVAFGRFLGTEPDGYIVRAVPPKQKYLNLRAGGDPDEVKLVLVLLLANYEKALIAGWVTAGDLRLSRGALDLNRFLRSDFPERKE